MTGKCFGFCELVRLTLSFAECDHSGVFLLLLYVAVGQQ